MGLPSDLKLRILRDHFADGGGSEAGNSDNTVGRKNARTGNSPDSEDSGDGFQEDDGVDKGIIRPGGSFGSDDADLDMFGDMEWNRD
ncbi:hypothetical protein BDN70DRAFT_940199 [Pholiota conissans]|uniref:Uncharacterized protein n=1 Tax=Pholiota conissans TaxID=109636 RepID=A0A9P6CRX0_9AGAR|nr:hypothetical protein BDN70DRAFT_940199 [Pholiota conissans]